MAASKGATKKTVIAHPKQFHIPPNVLALGSYKGIIIGPMRAELAARFRTAANAPALRAAASPGKRKKAKIKRSKSDG